MAGYFGSYGYNNANGGHGNRRNAPAGNAQPRQDAYRNAQNNVYDNPFPRQGYYPPQANRPAQSGNLRPSSQNAQNNAYNNPFSRQGQNYPRQANHPAQYGNPRPEQKNAEPYSDPSVVFEPLDEKTYAEIAKSLANPQGAKPAEALPVPEIAKPSDSRDKLLEIIQNERNGAKYYEKLRGYADGETSRLFREIGLECERNLTKLTEFYELMNGDKASIREAEINLPGDLGFNIKTAVQEESKALSVIRELCEKEESERVLRLLNDISLNKLISVNRMMLPLFSFL